MAATTYSSQVLIATNSDPKCIYSWKKLEPLFSSVGILLVKRRQNKDVKTFLLFSLLNFTELCPTLLFCRCFDISWYLERLLKDCKVFYEIFWDTMKKRKQNLSLVHRYFSAKVQWTKSKLESSFLEYLWCWSLRSEDFKWIGSRGSWVTAHIAHIVIHRQPPEHLRSTFGQFFEKMIFAPWYTPVHVYIYIYVTLPARKTWRFASFINKLLLNQCLNPNLGGGGSFTPLPLLVFPK